MGARASKAAGSSIPEFNIDDAAALLSKLHKRLTNAKGSDIKLSKQERAAISAAASILSTGDPGPKKPKPPAV